jgi:hypothetical protein
MFSSIAAVRAWLSAVWQWLVNAASACWRKAQPGVRDAWENFKERLRQAGDGLIDDLATVAKEVIVPTPQDQLPPAL